MSNFKSLVGDLALNCGASAPSSVLNQAGESQRFISWINQANKDIQNKWSNWRFLWVENSFTTEQGERNYSPYDDVGEWDFDRFRVGGTPVPAMEYHKWCYDQLEDEGFEDQPTVILVMPDNSLRLYPAPDATYTIACEYFKAPQEMTSNTDISWIPEKFHDVIWRWALLEYAYFESAPEVLERVKSQLPGRIEALEASQLPGNTNIHNSSQSFIEVVAE